MVDKTVFACPKCLGGLEFKPVPRCASCGALYGMAEGVYDFSGPDTAEIARKTVEQFGNSWKIFDHIEPYHLKQFLEWIFPVTAEDFGGKRVLEAGCGKGRHSRIVSGFEPEALYSIDLSEAIYVADRNVRAENCTFVRCDIRKLPFADSSFDMVFSAGVLHHVDEPAEGLKELWRTLKPGGRMVLWVYAREGNGWIVNFVDPVRKGITSRIPARVLRWLSMPLTVFLFVLLKALYGPLTGWGEKESAFLPYSSYLGAISPFPFREIDNIVVDHLCPPIAFYLSREDIEAMFLPLGPSGLRLRWHHRNSWTVVAEKRSP